MRRARAWMRAHPWTCRVVVIVVLTAGVAAAGIAAGYRGQRWAAGWFVLAGVIIGVVAARWRP